MEKIKLNENECKTISGYPVVVLIPTVNGGGKERGTFVAVICAVAL